MVKKKLFAIVLAAVLALSIGISAILYFQNQKNQQQEADTYTVIGTLTYAPWHAINPGISATNVTPTLSPYPSNLTFSEPNGQGGTNNYTVDYFIFVTFTGKFTYPTNSPAPIGFPTGFAEGDTVKLSGEISFNPAYQGYWMNVTSIVHYTS